jgi:hypothetical protein
MTADLCDIQGKAFDGFLAGVVFSERAGREWLSAAISIVSTASGLRGLSIISDIADTTSSTEIIRMHWRSKSQVFDRQHGAQGKAE